MVNIAVLGFGVVGSGVYELISKNFDSITRKAGAKINVKYILDIRDFSNHPNSEIFIKDYETILKDESVKIIVEVMGGTNPAYKYTKDALLAGKSVVTSNKELVATHGSELLKIAYDNNVKYLFEASVGGGIPIIRPLKMCLSANEIYEVCGILNGTTNYILTKMIKEAKSFDEALIEATDKGYAEKDPTDDVEGYDTCRKICILTSLVFGKNIDYKGVYTQGITKLTLTDVKYADEFGFDIKLIGYSKLINDKIDIKVSPMLVSKSHPLATVDDVFNGILVKGDAIGDAMFYGRGAGKFPTASAVVGDIIEIAKNPGRENSIIWENTGENIVLNINESLSGFLIRLETKDKSKTVSDVKNIFSNVTIIDKFDDEIGFMTKPMLEGDLKAKLTSLSNKVITAIRILD